MTTKVSWLGRYLALGLLSAVATDGQGAYAQVPPNPNIVTPNLHSSPQNGMGTASGSDPTSQTVLPPADVTGHLNDLETIADLQRKLQILKLQNQIATLQASIAKANGTTPSQGAAAEESQTAESDQSYGSQPTTAELASVPPEVAVIGGVAGHMSADILVPYAGEFSNVHIGDTLPDGDKIVDITPNGVTVELSSGARELLAEGSEVPAVLPTVTTQQKIQSAPLPQVSAPSLPPAPAIPETVSGLGQ